MGHAQTARNGEIDFWKFFFSLMVVQFHSSNMTALKTIPWIGAWPAVEFFFLISGYFMAASILRRSTPSVWIGHDTRDFLLHKIHGICPEIFIAWGIGFVVQHLAKEHVTAVTLLKDLLTGIWDLFFLRESGLVGFVANPAAWYISAMLLAMLLLVPLFLKNPELFVYVWAPAIALAALGYLCKTVGNLRGPTEWRGFCYKGLLRALGVLCTGVICYAVCNRIRQVRFSTLGKILLTVLELSCFLTMIVWCYGHRGSRMDYVMLLLLAAAVVVVCSGQSLISGFFQKPYFYFFGKLSLPLYLGHNYWSHALPRLFPKQDYAQLYPKYAAAAAVTTAGIYFAAKGMRKIAPSFFRQCRKRLLQQGPGGQEKYM